MFNENIGYVPPDYLDRYDTLLLQRDAILAVRREQQLKLFEPKVSSL